MTRRRKPTEVAPTEKLNCIKGYLAQLKLFKIRDLLEQQLVHVENGELSATEAVANLFGAEVQHQLERRIERRIRNSKLPERKTLDAFDFDFQPELDKRLVLELATMSFVSRRRGVILAGMSGTGKSHIAKALGLLGCKHGYRVRYTTAADMLRSLFASLADDSLDYKLKRHYLSPELLVIDEVGFDRLEQADARNAALFFKVIDGRYNKKSTVLTTNIDFEQLGHYLGDPLVTTSIVDRMVHHSTVIIINGPSWRMMESEMLNAENSPPSNPAPDTSEPPADDRPSTDGQD